MSASQHLSLLRGTGQSPERVARGPFLLFRFSGSLERFEQSFRRLEVSEAILQTQQDLRDEMGRFYALFGEFSQAFKARDDQAFYEMIKERGSEYAESSLFSHAPESLPTPTSVLQPEWSAIFRAIVKPASSIPLTRCLELLQAFQTQLDNGSRIERWMSVVELRSDMWRWSNQAKHGFVQFTALPNPLSHNTASK